MEANTERFAEGLADGRHGLMAWNAQDPAWLAGWIRGNEEREAAARARWLRDRARAQA